MQGKHKNAASWRQKEIGMILLIGGSSHTGKTLLAQRLLEKYSYPYLSLDHLKMGLIRTGLTPLQVGEDAKLREFVWPVAAEMIREAIANRQNLIVEGCYIPGHWADSFSTEELAGIRCLFVTMGEEYLRKNIAAVAAYANTIEQRQKDCVDEERLIGCSRMFREEAKAHNTANLDITEGFDIEEITARACRLLQLDG